MSLKLWAVVLLVASCTALPQISRRQDAPALESDVPTYDITTNHIDITEWLAIGDSFAAGVSADTPSDELNNACSRFKMSYPNQMQNNANFPGHSTSRKFTFGACTGDKMDDVLANQITLGTPDNKKYTPIGDPQIVTLSISGNDLGFGDIVNNCLYHWGNSHDCQGYLRSAHEKLDDPGKAMYLQLFKTVYGVLSRVRSTKQGPHVQLYVTGYIRFWQETNPQCNDISWATWASDEAKLTTTMRTDMNELVIKLNGMIKDVVEDVDSRFGGIWFVDEFDAAFDGHRFCEEEADPSYHKSPIDHRTWFIHYKSPYSNSAATGGDTFTDFFHEVDAVLIPPKDGMSTEDRINAAGGNYVSLNPAYENYDTMTAALEGLAAQNPDAYIMWPTTWIRVMHPKGSGYEQMANAVISKVIAAQAQAQSPPPPTPTPDPPMPAPAPPADPTKVMFLFYDNYIDEISDSMYWTAFEGKIADSINLCDSHYAAQFPAPGDGNSLSTPPWPQGPLKMKLFGQDDCEYASDGSGPGTINCPGMSEPKACVADMDTQEKNCIGAWADYYREVVRCLW